MTPVFFYGLFMDAALLREKGLHPTAGKIAWADGYGLRIGARATLVRAESERAYGVVASLTRDELDRLYSGPGVSEYLPEQLEVCDQSGGKTTVLCYNLPLSKLAGSNPEYAKALAVAAEKCGMPASYVEEILSWTK